MPLSLLEPLRQNPLYKRLTSHQGRPSLRTTAVLMLVLAVVSTVLILLGNQLVYPPACLINLIMPFVVAVSAGALTAREVADPSFRLIEITNLRKRQILQAYTAGTIYRLRVRLAISLGLLPGLIVGAWTTLLRVTNNTPPVSDHVISIILIAAALWGWNLTAAAFGAWEGYITERVGMSVAGAIVLTVAGYALTALLIPLVLNIPIPLVNVVGMVCIAGFPYLITYLIVSRA